MAAYHCCVPLCVNDSRKKNPKISFHSFPTDPKRRAEWIVKIRRDPGDLFQVKPHTKVCSAHFTSTDFKRCLTGRKVLLQSAVPSVFSWTTDKHTRPSPAKRRYFETVSDQTSTDFSEEVHSQLVAAKREIERLQKELGRAKSLSWFGLLRYSYNEEMINFYTGFPSWKLLEMFISLVKPCADKIKTWSQEQRNRVKQNKDIPVAVNHDTNYAFVSTLCTEDQLLLFLCKIKLGLFEQDLEERFQISISTVSRTLVTWTNYLYFLQGSLPIWPSREQVDKTMPRSFKDAFPTVRVIIDCTEIKVQTTSSLTLHSEFYSNYKSATTLKGLIGISPTGAVSFVSALYTGSISDREITRRSGLVELLEPNDGVMADKGFTIEDIVTPRNCTLNIPPFLREKPQFSADDVKKTQQIAKLRIHVERAIRRAKEYHLFDSIVPLSLFSSINQLWTVCCILTNFKGPLF
ncbi:uncharacterized protein [Montipora foliosa]|uniref:uncharacterized protein n=1 Tax=Montipora foliosa TaxID=591990 RepID=UPI0035F100CB